MTAEKSNEISRVFYYVVGFIIAATCVGSVPFANNISSRLATIEQRLTLQDTLLAEQNTMKAQLTEVRIRLAKLDK